LSDARSRQADAPRDQAGGEEAGNKHRRAELKRNLSENPEEAAHAEENLGRYRSDTLNKLDNDSTRRKKDEGPKPE
jgi:hypothetical protein